MNPTVVGTLLLALLVVPGFWHYMVSRSVRTWDDADPFEPTIFLISLGLTSLLVSVEAIVLGVVTQFSGAASSQLSELWLNGIASFGTEHPGEIFIFMPSLFLLNSLVLGGLGAFDPMGELQARLLTPKKVRKESAWYLAFRPTEAATSRSSSDAQEDESNFVQIYMHGERLPRYRGAVAAFDLRSDRHGERNIAL